MLPIENNLVATGDDDGIIKLWSSSKDGEKLTLIQTYDHHTDWITDMFWCTHLDAPRARNKDEALKRKREETRDGDSRSRLICTSGDGSLSVIDVRSKKPSVDVSEDQEDELLSVAAIKRYVTGSCSGKKLVVGTQLGILSLWAPSKGILDHVDRFPGHPSSVDAICMLDDDTVLTGSSDGLIRVVQLFPHKLLGIVADHDGMPVEVMRRKGHFVASLGHGSECKLTDLRPLLEGADEEGEEEDEEAITLETPTVARSAEVSDDSDSSEDEQPPLQRQRGGPALSDTLDTQADAREFFADL